MLLKVLSRCLLNRHRTSATSLESLSQCLTTLMVNKCFPMPSLILFWCSFVPFPYILPLIPRSRAQHLPLLPLLRAVMLSLRLFSRLKIPMSSAFPLMTYPPALRPPLVPSSRHLQGPSHSFYTVGPSTVHSIQGEAKPMLNVAVVSPLLTSWLCCL